MSRTFRSNLKQWLTKTIIHNKMGKKELVEMVNAIGTSQIKDSKSTLEEKLLEFLCTKLQDLKQQNRLLAHGFSFIYTFVTDNGASLSDHLKDLINNLIQKYANNIDDNERNYQQIISNALGARVQNYECVCIRSVKDLQFEQPKEVCYKCGRQCHVNCMWSRQNKQDFYECPLCFLVNCVPNRQTKEVLFAGYLRQCQRDKIQYKINFPLQQDTYQDCLIEVRCARLSKDTKYELTWPSDCNIRLNNKKIAELKPLLVNSCFKKRYDQEIILYQKYFEKQNCLTICQRHHYSQQLRYESAKNHMVVILITKKLSVQESIRKMSNDKFSVYQSKQHLQEYISRGIKDVSIDKINISLRSPFFDKKISLPVRSKHCVTHYQPFDLRDFIMANMNLKANPKKWKCPFCNKRAYHIILDVFLLKQIRQNPRLNVLQCSLQNCSNALDDEQQDILYEQDKIQIYESQEFSSFYNPVEDNDSLDKKEYFIDENQVCIISSSQQNNETFNLNKSYGQEGSVQCINLQMKEEQEEEVVLNKKQRTSIRKRKGQKLQYQELQPRKHKKRKVDKENLLKKDKIKEKKQVKSIQIPDNNEIGLDCQDNEQNNNEIRLDSDDHENLPQFMPIITQNETQINKEFIRYKLDQINKQLNIQSKNSIDNSHGSFVDISARNESLEKTINLSKQSKTFLPSTAHNSCNQETLINKSSIQILQLEDKHDQIDDNRDYILIQDSSEHEVMAQDQKIRAYLYDLNLQKEYLKLNGPITKQDELLFVSLCQNLMISQFQKAS